MTFPRYPAYKDSGVEWLGEVPAHWEILPCRAFVDERTDKNSEVQDENYLSLLANVGVIPYEEKGDIGNKKPEDLGKCKLVNPGDLVINSMNYGIGSYGLSSLKGVCSPVYIVLRPRLSVVESRYAFRIFQNREFQTYAQSFGNGILAHRAAIGWDTLKGIHVGLPPMSEQETILKFLDHETSKIDALVAEQQNLIALLKEKRQAVISHAVTKGLNPDVPMKDSGVEWLGEVPVHWEVRRLRDLGTVTNGFPFDSSLFDPLDGIPLVRIRDIYSGETEVRWRGEPVAAAEIEDGDVLIGMDGDFNVAWWSGGYAMLNQRVCCVRMSVVEDQRLVFFSLPIPLRRINDLTYSTTVKHLSSFDVERIRLAWPSPEERRHISVFLDHETAKIDALIGEAEHATELLQERRSALISAAVTGKIDVRGLVSQEAA